MHDLTPAQNFVAHASGTRVHTETYMIAELRSAHPDQQVISVSPQPLSSCEAALLKYADETGEATYNAVAADDLTFGPLFTTHQYIPPKRRIDAGSDGKIGEKVKFGRYEYSYKGQVYLLYICEGREGNFMTNERIHQFLVHEKTTQAANDVSKLITAVGQWASELHEEIWVFDQGRWTKDKGLWKGVEKSHWKNVILDQERKSAIQEDARLFFDNKEVSFQPDSWPLAGRPLILDRGTKSFTYPGSAASSITDRPATARLSASRRYQMKCIIAKILWQRYTSKVLRPTWVLNEV